LPDSNYQLGISTRTYTGSLLIVVLFLVSIHIGLILFNNRVHELPWLLLQLFHLDEEHNIPTWFSSFLLLNNAFFFYLYARSDVSSTKTYWTLIATGFLLLAVDEVAGLHETLNSSIEINWAIPAAIIVVIVGIGFVPFLLSLRRGLAALLILSGILYFSGALIVELLSEDMDSDSSIYALSVALEEGLEMLGALLCLTTILNEMKSPEKDSVVVSVDIA
jgi:hypothetical protein